AQTGDVPLDSDRGGPPAPAAVKTPEKRAPAPADPTGPGGPGGPGSNDETARPADPAGAKTDADWPGFRGRARDGIVRGVRIETDWSQKPPVAIWRRPI